MHGTVNLLAETESITSSPIAIFPLVLLASLRLRRPWAVQSVRTETISLAALGCIPRKTYSNGALRLKSTIWGSFGNLARLLCVCVCVCVCVCARVCVCVYVNCWS